MTGMTILRGPGSRRPWGNRRGERTNEVAGPDGPDEAWLEAVAEPESEAEYKAEPEAEYEVEPEAEAEYEAERVAEYKAERVAEYKIEAEYRPAVAYKAKVERVDWSVGDDGYIAAAPTTTAWRSVSRTRPVDTDLADRVAQLRDDVMLATDTMTTLVQSTNTEMSALVAQVAQLAEEVRSLRTHLTVAPEPAAPEPTAPEPAAPEPTVPEPTAAEPTAAEPTAREVPEQLPTRVARVELPADAAVTAAAARIGLPKTHIAALQKWVANDGRGVVEVAHPGGRHRVGLAAVVYAVSTGRQVVVVVPGIEAAQSWRSGLAAHAPEMRVLIDEGRSRSADDQPPHVVVSTASTTARRLTAGFEPAALLVAVDAERFGTALAAKALDERCEWRLGLSEFYPRGDRGLAKYADDYFGGTVVSIS